MSKGNSERNNFKFVEIIQKRNLGQSYEHRILVGVITSVWDKYALLALHSASKNLYLMEIGLVIQQNSKSNLLPNRLNNT